MRLFYSAFICLYIHNMFYKQEATNEEEKFLSPLTQISAIAHGMIFDVSYWPRPTNGRRVEREKREKTEEEKEKRRGGWVCQKSVAAGIPIRFHPLRKVPSVEGKPERVYIAETRSRAGQATRTAAAAEANTGANNLRNRRRAPLLI